MKFLMIFNPHASHKRAMKLIDPIKNYFAESGNELYLELTKYSGNGIEITEETDLSGFDGIIAAGGDGTTFEVLNGYFRNQSSKKPPFGVVPTGTGNAFAREFGLNSNDWKRAVDRICNNNLQSVDVGKFQTGGDIYYFVNILGFGFVADVANSGHKLKAIGEIAYSLAVFYELIRLNSYKLKMYIDGQIIERDNIFVEISNTKYTGVSFLMAPDAEADDGLLDVTILNKCTRRRILKLFPTIFKGLHIHEQEVETYKVRKIRLETEYPKILTPDGELLGSTPIEVECLEKALQIFG